MTLYNSLEFFVQDSTALTHTVRMAWSWSYDISDEFTQESEQDLRSRVAVKMVEFSESFSSNKFCPTELCGGLVIEVAASSNQVQLEFLLEGIPCVALFVETCRNISLPFNEVSMFCFVF